MDFYAPIWEVLIVLAVVIAAAIYTSFLIKNKKNKVANVTCDRCNAIAPEGTKFCSERIPFYGTRVYCPKCHVKLEDKFILWLVVSNLCLGLFCVIYLWANPLSPFCRACVNLFLVQLVILPSVIVHEFAHAIVGKLSGLTVLGIWIGRGSTFYHAKILGFDTEFKVIPVDGFTFLSYGFKDQSRFRYILAILAGPMANAIILVIALRFVTWDNLNITTSIQLGEIIFFVQALILVGNLLPYRIQTARGKLCTDGLSLLQLLTSKSPEFLSSQLGKEAKDDAMQRKLDPDPYSKS
ncbi:MAG TPA: site-2 protease family protein [Phycisphaerae bacterium]|nr:site-2 protease family protein [Phycisphaerae bacterium]